MNLAFHAIQQTAIGAKILAEWLGAGGIPVTQEVADARAGACLKCPLHRQGEWWEKYISDPIAKVIQRHLSIKQAANMRLAREDEVGMCSACGCCIRLKAHVPIAHIKSHTSNETFQKYHVDCWAKKEIQAS